MATVVPLANQGIVMRSLLLAVAATALVHAVPVAAQQYHVAAQLPAGDGGWDLLSVDPVAQRLYVARPDGVTAIDLKSGKAIDRFVPGQRVHAALAIPGTRDVISTNGETNNALLFDGMTGKVRATIPTGTKPDAAAYDPATRTVWVMNPGSGDVTVVDPATAKVLATVPVGGSLELGVADGNGRMYVNVEDRNEVVVLDTKARKLLSRFPLNGCDGPTGIAYDPASREILSACGGNAVAIVSAPDGRQVAQLPIGKGADGAAFDEKRGLALVPGGRDGNVTIIRLGAVPKAIGQVPTAVSARTIAVDPATGRAYLPSAKLAPAAPGERPKPVPGTFRVLVVAP
jgi:YVTN family beta-propeller protein